MSHSLDGRIPPSELVDPDSVRPRSHSCSNLVYPGLQGDGGGVVGATTRVFEEKFRSP